jgi:beta-mannosidase
VTLTNPTKQVAVMAHLQLRDGKTNKRILPVFYTDNYVSLLPGESKIITIDASDAGLGLDKPLVVLDGWNVTTKPFTYFINGGVDVAPNTDAIVVRPVAKTASN